MHRSTTVAVDKGGRIQEFRIDSLDQLFLKVLCAVVTSQFVVTVTIYRSEKQISLWQKRGFFEWICEQIIVIIKILLAYKN